MTPVTQYYPLYAPDSPVCQGLREAVLPPVNPKGEVMWARVKAYLTANPDEDGGRSDTDRHVRRDVQTGLGRGRGTGLGREQLPS